MKKILLFGLLATAINSFAQQKGMGKILSLEDNKTTSFEWTKYYDEDASTFATTYLFYGDINGRNVKMGVLIVHDKQNGQIEYTWEFKGGGERYLAADRRVDISDLEEMPDNALALESDACNNCYDIEIKYTSSKQERVNVLMIRNMRNNTVLFLETSPNRLKVQANHKMTIKAKQDEENIKREQEAQIASRAEEKKRTEEEVERKRKAEEIERLRRERETQIRSKIYDLREYNLSYNKFIDDYKKAIQTCFSRFTAGVSFDDAKKQREKYVRIRSKYKDHFKSFYYPMILKLKVERNTSLIEGVNDYADCSINVVPSVMIEGVEAGAEVEIEPQLDFVKGVSEITVSKSGVIKFKNEPPTEIQEKLLSKLREANTPKGNFVLNYTYSKIMDNEDAQIQLLYKKTNKEVTEETERKRKRKTKAIIGGVVGGIGLVGVLVGLSFL